MLYRIRHVKEMDDHIAEDIRAMHLVIFGIDLDKQFDPEKAGEWWLVYHEGEAAPIAFAGTAPSVVVENYVFLMRAGVMKDHRGHGLQRRLIRVREQFARRHGYLGLVSYTEDNPHSANNLIACGLRSYRPPHPFVGAHVHYWKKVF